MGPLTRDRPHPPHAPSLRAARGGDAMSGGVVRVNLPAPHAGQAKIDAAFAAGARFVVVLTARQFGKSTDLVRRAVEQFVAGGHVGVFVPQLMYATENWREILEALADLLPMCKKDEQKRRIEFPANGGMIEVWSFDSNEDAGRGRRYDMVLVDEAGLIGDLLTKWRLAMRATLVAKRGRAVFYGTPKGAKSDFVMLANQAEQDEGAEWACVRARTLDNPYIPAEEVELARRDMSPEQFAQEFEGVPMDDGASPLTPEVIAAAVAPASDGRPVMWGIDLARSGDWCWMIAFDEWGKWCRSERWQGAWSVTKRRIADTLRREGGQAVVDSTGVGDAIVDDLLNAGCDQITRFVFSETKRRHLVEGVITALHGKRHTIPGDEHGGQLRRELGALGVEWRNGKPYYEVPASIHDDGIMALGMAMWGYNASVPIPSWPKHVSETRPWRADLDNWSIDQTLDAEVETFAGLGSGW